MMLHSEDIELIKKLLEKDNVSLYDLHKEFLLSPSQLVVAVDKLLDVGYIILDNMSVSLTDLGKKWLDENASTILVQERTKYWKELPKDMLQKPVAINELYKPNIDKIRKEVKILAH